MAQGKNNCMVQSRFLDHSEILKSPCYCWRLLYVNAWERPLIVLFATAILFTAKRKTFPVKS